MANKLFQAFIDTAKTIAGYPITVANAVFMRDGSTLDEFSENIPHREDNEDTDIEVPNIDADMLNGHPASYYAKQSDLSALNTSVTQVNSKIGNTDVSKWGNSLTGAIKAACDKSDANETAIADVNSNFSNLIKTYTEKLTTDENGIFLISLNIDRPLLAIKCITNNDIALIPYSNENAGYGNWVVSSYVSYSFTRFSNQTITVKYWYI